MAVVGAALWLHRGGWLLFSWLSLLCNVDSVRRAKRTDRSRVQTHYGKSQVEAALFFSHSLGVLVTSVNVSCRVKSMMEYCCLQCASSSALGMMLKTVTEEGSFPLTCRSCLAASAPALVLKVTKPTGCKNKRNYCMLCRSCSSHDRF